MVDALNKIVARGRGALENPTGRFERRFETIDIDAWQDPDEPDECRIETQVFWDRSKTILASNDSPDVFVEATLNPYRGCEHGCIYCYARPGHEYFGLSAGLDFETKIFAKPDAPKLLEEALSARSWVPRPIAMSGVTDCYQPVERKLKITRGCLEVLADFRNPVSIITKSALVTRDIDVLQSLAADNAARVFVSVTTLDSSLSRNMEPRAAQPLQRLRAIEQLAKAGIPVGVMVGPIVPGLTDHETPGILKAVADAGAFTAGYTVMRLPYGVKDLFQTWVEQHYPDRAARVLARVRDMRDGKLNDSNFGTRMIGTGPFAEQIAQMFAVYRRRYGLDVERKPLSAAAFRRDARSGQGQLF